jgi:methylated-DNA-[protein]-cysteine S-methyltransferase
MNPALPFPCVAVTRIESPLDPLLAAWTPRGLAALSMQAQRHAPSEVALTALERQGRLPPPWHDWDAALRHWLARYFAGEAIEADHAGLPLDLHGTPFQQRVWAQLLTIAWGRRTNYGAIAEALGQPRASRAVGAAVGRNPVAILVPCHRVIGRDGSLTGYAGGLARKRRLLELERLLTPPSLSTGDLFASEEAR